MTDTLPSHRQQLLELVSLFLRLGFTAFGGPSAHISMYHDEVVKRRRWLTEEHFLDLLGATNLIPGPNSTEMTMHIGYVRRGLPGMILAGISFILPSALIVLPMAWAYVRYGSTPQAAWLMYGVKPVVIALILQALFDMGRKAVKNPLHLSVGILSCLLYFLNVSPIMILLICGAALLIWYNLRHFTWQRIGSFIPVISLSSLPSWINSSSFTALAPLFSQPFSIALLFLTFLKIGAVLYGSGYVLLAFLNADFVYGLGWLTSQQILDAVAVGQVTPGPVLTSATFIGYILAGLPGAIIATVGIFLPSFVFVAISNPLIPRIRNSPFASSFLDGIIIASLGLMAAVTFQLAIVSFTDAITLIIGFVSLVLLIRWRVNSTWLILAGLIIGILINYPR